jgi:hypothetical protein
LDVLENHVPDLPLDIARLVADGHPCQAGQIDQGEVEDVGRIDAQVDRGGRDAGVAADLGLGLPADLIANLVEVVELLAGDVQELAPLLRVGLLVGAVGDLLLGAVYCLPGPVDELEDERAAGDDAGATRQAICEGACMSVGEPRGCVGCAHGGGQGQARYSQVATDNVF